MNSLRLTAILSIAALSLARPAEATPWHVMGPRAMGMGGAGVAVAQGPLASYWNPAGLGQLYNVNGGMLSASFRAAFVGKMLEGANDLNRINQDCQKAGGGAGTGYCQTDKVRIALAKLGDKTSGADADAGAALSIKVKKLVFFAHGLDYMGVTALVDQVNNTDAALVANANTSRLILRGGLFTEVGLGYGTEIRESGIVVGASVKAIQGKIGYSRFNLFTDKPDSKVFTDYNKNTKSSVQPGVDAGLLWDLRETYPSLPMRPRIGVVGRNLNDPKFDQPQAASDGGAPARYSLHGQARAGVALSPFRFWHLAADVDLTDNLTTVEGVKSRYLSAGTEIDLVNHPAFNIPLRAGVQKDLSGESSLAYTAGLGINLLHLVVDIAGSISSDRTDWQSEEKTEKIPNNFGASLNVGFLFGGKDTGVRNK